MLDKALKTLKFNYVSSARVIPDGKPYLIRSSNTDVRRFGRAGTYILLPKGMYSREIGLVPELSGGDDGHG